MEKLMEISSSNEYQDIMKTLTDIRFVNKISLKKNIMKKLNNLYKGNVFIKEDNGKYINLQICNYNRFKVKSQNILIKVKIIQNC